MNRVSLERIGTATNILLEEVNNGLERSVLEKVYDLLVARIRYNSLGIPQEVSVPKSIPRTPKKACLPKHRQNEKQRTWEDYYGDKRTHYGAPCLTLGGKKVRRTLEEIKAGYVAYCKRKGYEPIWEEDRRPVESYQQDHDVVAFADALGESLPE
jgi:hypothetical protein